MKTQYASTRYSENSPYVNNLQGIHHVPSQQVQIISYFLVCSKEPFNFIRRCRVKRGGVSHFQKQSVT